MHTAAQLMVCAAAYACCATPYATQIVAYAPAQRFAVPLADTWRPLFIRAEHYDRVGLWCDGDAGGCWRNLHGPCVQSDCSYAPWNTPLRESCSYMSGGNTLRASCSTRHSFTDMGVHDSEIPFNVTGQTYVMTLCSGAPPGVSARMPLDLRLAYDDIMPPLADAYVTGIDPQYVVPVEMCAPPAVRGIVAAVNNALAAAGALLAALVEPLAVPGNMCAASALCSSLVRLFLTSLFLEWVHREHGAFAYAFALAYVARRRARL